MITIDQIELSDLPKIEEVSRGLFPLPNINNPLYKVRGAIKLDDRIIGAVFVHITSEISLIMNQNISKITQSRAIAALKDPLLFYLEKLGLEDTHAFIQPAGNYDFAELLCRHFGFVPATGIPIYLNIRGARNV